MINDKYIDKCIIFVKHIEKHIKEEGLANIVICKICGKTIDEIYEDDKYE